MDVVSFVIGSSAVIVVPVGDTVKLVVIINVIAIIIVIVVVVAVVVVVVVVVVEARCEDRQLELISVGFPKIEAAAAFASMAAT